MASSQDDSMPFLLKGQKVTEEKLPFPDTLSSKILIATTFLFIHSPLLDTWIIPSLFLLCPTTVNG